MKLLCNNRDVKGLHPLINKCASRDNISDGHYVVRKIGGHKMITRHEMRLTTQIGEYEMDHVILDLGSDANVLPRQTWEKTGRPALQWSLVQLRMENQQKIIPMRSLHGVTIDIEGASASDNFKIIEIVVGFNPVQKLPAYEFLNK